MRNYGKKSSLFTACLLILFMLFSLVFCISESKHDCSANNECAVCCQIEDYQEELNAILSSKHICTGIDCAMCFAIDDIETQLATMINLEHICVTNDCFICHQINACKDILKKFFMVRAICALTAISVCVFCTLLQPKENKNYLDTLITLKVKLSS